MKIRIKQSLSTLLRNNPWIGWSRYVFISVGILALGYAGYALLDARLYQADQSKQFQTDLNRLKPSIDCDEPIHGSSISTAPSNEGLLKTDIMEVADSVGRIEIPAIGLAAMIMEGTDARTLRHAVGHIPGSPLPGQRGNVAITGHRDTFFRPLRKIRRNDEIRLTTLSGSYRYGVDFIKIVEPEDTEVLNNSDDAILTLVTCYPFYYVGPAPKRLIVRAHRIRG